MKIVKSTVLEVFSPTFWQCCVLQGTKVRNRACELRNLANFVAGNFLMVYIPFVPRRRQHCRNVGQNSCNRGRTLNFKCVV